MSLVYGDGAADQALPKRPVGLAMRRGALGRCPKCGEGHLFDGFVTVAAQCPVCGEAMHHHRADDFPPYATIFIVGHVVVPAMYFVEKIWHPDLWIHAALWLPLTLILSVALLRPIKGAIIGLQWALYMHGFHPGGAEDDAPSGQTGGPAT
ncbi:DUF983 domain-containing protein [Prosthecomicrobium hirschii]|uniref:DUF983 domain-containing protein n=1 Tax=Prosthecodimorpha hirschii TaxID=665126 RepID=UPI00112DA464|nr:DUF983 domain-containing protein [Prosthecomicrobium hirschii]MCW1839143.1 DUF983 domain-containing protein [Prosthecomicrobium hirschii]TPQ51597.1 hypothetical protein C2U72_07460 [Prosthecomicrobium hirschii]